MNKIKELVQRTKAVEEAKQLTTLETLADRVVVWADEKGISETGTVSGQTMKLWEEFGELNKALRIGSHEDIIDAIGDVAVVVIILLAMGGQAVHSHNIKRFSTHDQLPIDFHTDSSRMMVTLSQLITSINAGVLEQTPYGCDPVPIDGDGNYAPYYVQQAHRLLNYLNVCAVFYVGGATLEGCLEEAYEVISQRSGKMINGVFVKDEA